MNNTFRKDFTSETKRRIDKNRKALGICLAAILLTMMFAATAPSVAAQSITVDGYETEAAWASAQCIDDPSWDLSKAGTPINYNHGYDIEKLCTLYDSQNETLYFKFNTNGTPGDVDGDGNPNSSSNPSIGDSFEVDTDGSEFYIVYFDVNEDYTADYYLEFTNNSVKLTQIIGTVVIPGTGSGSIGSWPYTNTVVEMSFSPTSNISGFGECDNFSVYGYAGDKYDGWSEDDTNWSPANAAPECIAVVDNNCYCTNTTFDASNSYDPDGTIVNYTWAFGDGYFGYGETVEHHYNGTGEYTVTLTLTDDYGFVCSNTTNVTVYTNPTANFTAPPVCNGTTTQFTDTSTNGSGTITNWTWNFGDNTSLNYSQHPAHTYAGPGEYSVTLTVTDDNDCTNTTVKNVTVSAPPTVVVNDTAFCNGTSGVLCANVTGGTGAYNYTWSPGGEHTQCITVSTAGTYTVVVIDEAGCVGNDSATVTVYELPTVVVNDTAFCSGSSDVLCANVTGGTGPYNYVWRKGASEIANVTGQPDWHCITVTAGDTYTVTVTDSHDCEDSDSATVTVYTLPTVTVADASFCEGTSVDICANVTPGSGTGPFDYIWRNVTTGAVVGSITGRTQTWHCITITEPGSYNVTVTDNHGCEGNDSAAVTETEPPTVTVDDVGFCEGGSDVLIASVSGGSGGNSYLWNTGATTQQITVTEAGEYNVTVTDSNGCEGFDNATVTVYPAPEPHIMYYTSRCNLTVQFEGSATGGASPYTYEWDFGDGNTSTDQNPVNTFPDFDVSYPITLTVTDNNSCNDTATATIRLTCTRPNTTIRVYGEDDIGPKCPYEQYRDPFDPTSIEKDSLTFNPAIILWDGSESPMSASSNNIHEKKFLRLWYEPAHEYSKPVYVHPTIEVETTYMLIDAQDWIPISGAASTTFFKFPIVEIPAQIGLGGFENEEGIPQRDNVVTLSLVDGVVDRYNKTVNGKIRIEKTYILEEGETVQFLDHKLQYQYISTKDGKSYAKVKMWYAGNINDDSERIVLLGEFDDGTASDPHKLTWFKRHNERYSSPNHPDTTWYAQFKDYFPSDYRAEITVGKELEICDTFYVNGVRYDVMAIEVIDTTGDTEADEFKYITIKTPLPKGKGSVPDDGIASSQQIECIDFDEQIPLNPPFNEDHLMVDDINVVLWQPTANVVEWPVGDPEGTLGVSYFPWAERYLTMQEEDILLEVQCGKNVGEAWLDYFDATDANHNDMKVDTDHDGVWIAYDVNERILEVTPLEFVYLEETIEPRFTTDLYEILDETFLLDLPPEESWTWFDINTRPDNYTAFELPPLPDVETPYNSTKPGDYLLTSSFLAPNSLNRSDLNRTPPGIPRLAFAYDVEHEKDVLDEVLMGGGLDLYVNDYGNNVSIRIYGEYDKGPVPAYGDKGTFTYESYQQPFDPAVLQKDSITFNPAIVIDGEYGQMSADSVDIDVKKYLRMWYEPEHVYSKPTYKHPTIEVETTYLLIDTQDKYPISGSANTTYFVFPITEDTTTDQPGLELFENPNSNPDRENRVTLAYVNGTVEPYNKTVYNNATIRLQKTYLLQVNESVQFLDHNLEFVGVVADANETYYAKVRVMYTGNPTPDSEATVVLGESDDPHGLTWFDRHSTEYTTPDHPERTWYAVFENYDPSYGWAEITVGKELMASDTFYVDSVRYDVAAIEVIDTDGNEFADKFKYITLRTPLPKAPTKTLVDDDGIISTQEIWTLPPETIIPLNPPFNMVHDIVDDIEHAYDLSYSVANRIIEDYAPLEVYYIAEAIEPRYSTNLLEILNETFYDDRAPAEDWIKYDVITRPDQYTEFILPPDIAHHGLTYSNDYLITTSFLANNSIGDSTLIDPVYGIPRAAFVFDAIDNTGIYVNKPLGAPPVVFNEAPNVSITVTPGTTVSALTTITVCTNGTTDDQFEMGPPRALTIVIDWKDGTYETKSMPDAWTPVCFEHYYTERGTYDIAVTATDIYGLTDTETASVEVTNDGAILVFKPGWNAFSTPVSSTSTVGSLFGGFGWFYAVYTWDETNQQWDTLASTETLDPARGYFVHGPVSGTETIALTGDAATYDVSWMKNGWNLVGTGFNPVELPYDKWAYWWDHGTNVYLATHNMEPGKGYFMKTII